MVEGALGTVFGGDADAGVDDHDEREDGVGPAAGGQDEDGGDREDEVEEGEDVGAEDGAEAAGAGSSDVVDVAGGDAFGDLGVGEGVGGCVGVVVKVPAGPSSAGASWSEPNGAAPMLCGYRDIVSVCRYPHFRPLSRYPHTPEESS
ncbi:hypothetical protein GCM10025864_35480 [Luteimicrobium album]|uniref:Uncharacterized protein n=1 Tax=Luteimicrobium album TaxID=1054550 RepID=A0ABQ6I7N9_9MICO|nr:hypothetical protein [Luteimicrobium album]GMA25789.1 hypothetical protein GCM10025864_35480 [Luteimicrobium album]